VADVKLSLLQNAHSFAIEALSKAILAENEPAQWKYAILNLVQAIELSLKELLRRQHPSLIYKGVDKQTETVSLKFARSRLEQIAGIKFDKTDLDSIQTASEYRNRIVHYEFNFKTEDAKLIFAKLLGFLQNFHSAHFDNHLSSIIPSSVWQEAVGVLDYAKELFERAQARWTAEKIDPSLIWACRHCCWEAFVIQDNKNTCYVCGVTDKIYECDECHQLLYCDDHSDFQKDGKRTCRRCINAMEGIESHWSDDEEYRKLIGLE
jgi:hypothetical protein